MLIAVIILSVILLVIIISLIIISTSGIKKKKYISDNIGKIISNPDYNTYLQLKGYIELPFKQYALLCKVASRGFIFDEVILIKLTNRFISRSVILNNNNQDGTDKGTN